MIKPAATIWQDPANHPAAATPTELEQQRHHWAQSHRRAGRDSESHSRRREILPPEPGSPTDSESPRHCDVTDSDEGKGAP